MNFLTPEVFPEQLDETDQEIAEFECLLDSMVDPMDLE